MERIFLSNYKEYGAENAPSMMEMSSGEPYAGKEKIVNFLNENGKAGLATAKIPSDRITGERIGGELILKETDRFSWWSDLAYHVEKYNLHLSKEFEDYVLSNF